MQNTASLDDFWAYCLLPDMLHLRTLGMTRLALVQSPTWGYFGAIIRHGRSQEVRGEIDPPNP